MGNSTARFVFDSEENITRDPEGKIVTKHTEFFLEGSKNKKWSIINVIHGIEEIAGSFAEDIYEGKEFFIRTYSEATDELEKPKTKAIYIEDYSEGSPKAVVVFPYLSVSEEDMIKAIDLALAREESEWISNKGAKKPKDRKRLPIPQKVQRKVLVRSEGRCEKCDNSLGNVTPHIHHKNGDPKDNNLSNLIVLCPNCHSRTLTYKKPKAPTHAK